MLANSSARHLRNPSAKARSIHALPENVGHNTRLAESIAAPADSSDVAVIEIPQIGGVGLLRIGDPDSLVQSCVRHVLRVVVLALLTGRVRRIADDDPDVGPLLAFAPISVVLHVERQFVVAFVQGEGVGQADAGIREVIVASGDRMEDGLDVDGGDVVGEQHDFVGVDLLAVLALQVRRAR